VVLVAITGVGVLHQYGGIRLVGVDALCPFGGIETFWTLLTAGTLVKQIAVSSLILLAAVLVIAIVFRRAFCGQICPLGAMQELAGKLGGSFRKHRRPLAVPQRLDKAARYLKYAVLAFFTLWTFQAAALVIRPYDPWVAWMHLSTTEVWGEFGIGLAVLGISIVGSVVYDRFFCKYLCPMGATLGLISRFSIFKVLRDADVCIDCGACDKACPMNVTVSSVETVHSAECINCNECVNACPVSGALTVSIPHRTRAISTVAMWAATLGISIAIVGAASIAGAFEWTVPTLAASATSSGGTINVEDIKGSMTFEEISAATGIPTSAFAQEWRVAASDMSVPIKDVAATYGFDVHTGVREFVRQQMEAAGK